MPPAMGGIVGMLQTASQRRPPKAQDAWLKRPALSKACEQYTSNGKNYRASIPSQARKREPRCVAMQESHKSLSYNSSQGGSSKTCDHTRRPESIGVGKRFWLSP